MRLDDRMKTLYDKKYVYFDWDDKLEGKKVILAHNIKDLKDFVERGDEDRFFIVKKGKDLPFFNGYCDCAFAYYDPNLKVKKALLEGNEVQYYSNFNKWQDLNLVETCNIKDYLNNEDWDKYEWRIKPTEEMKNFIYDKKYVYFEWDDKLEGKECFIADYIDNLKWNVNNKSNLIQVTKNEGNDSYPFRDKDTDGEWCFAYYDPYYELKLAFKENKILQWKSHYEDDDMWRDWCNNYCPTFENYSCEWRIKPTEIFYVIFEKTMFETVKVLSMSPCFTIYFKGTQEECDKWIKEHKSFAKILSACKNGETIQYRQRNDVWHSWELDLLPTIKNLEDYEWRIKPNEKIAECYYINIHELDNMNTIDISKHAYNPIFWGSIKQCDYVLKLITDKFRLDKCLYRCKNTKCYKCDKLLNFVKNIEFKSTRRMTNRELSEWLAKGNGEVRTNDTLYPSCYYTYNIGSENVEVGYSVFIREWDSDEWKEPLIEI